MDAVDESARRKAGAAAGIGDVHRRGMDFAWVVAAVLAVKLAWLVADSTLRLYMGDSMTYLGTAFNFSFTGGRSFVYGWILRFTVLPFDSPGLIVVLQSLWSAATAIALFGLLTICLGVRRWIALLVAVLLATEPAQVFLERMVMAETAGLLAFVVGLLLFVVYLRTMKIRWYALGVLLGLGCINLRLSFLPVVLGTAFVVAMLPLLDRARRPLGIELRAAGAALVLLLASHFAYVQAYGHFSGTGPGYLAMSGMMRIGLVAPLIRAEHFEGTDVSGSILDDVRRPLDDHWQRGHHIWKEDGLWPLLVKRSAEPEQVARVITRRAMLDAPLELVRINIATLGGYFAPGRVRWRMLDDLGVIPPSEADLGLIKREMGWDARGISRLHTPARDLFAASGPWLTFCLFVLAPLALSTLAVGWRRRERRMYLLLGLVSLGLVASHLLFAHIVSFRYIHPLPFFVLANVAVLAEVFRRRIEAREPFRQADD
ncbi:hypothetical protein [Lysobacter sp. F6437]|uniref:hypothetical protein n=1 Tax=Lysobacter sp. F6437 TaxID=3459296 RepID=UPI00403E283A